jgi:hypothetical protein
MAWGLPSLADTGLTFVQGPLDHVQLVGFGMIEDEVDDIGQILFFDALSSSSKV